MAKRPSKKERAQLNAQMDKEWAKERKRIMDYGRKLEKRGFKLDADFVPAKSMKRHDKRILESLKKFRGNEMYKKVSFSAKGKTVHGKRAKAFAREVKRQDTQTPKADPLSNLKEDLEKLYANLKDTVQSYDWGTKQLLFDMRGIKVDVIGKIEELRGTIEQKFNSLTDASSGQDYYNYLLANMGDINNSIQAAYEDSTGAKFLASVDKAINLILQQSPREFDSEEFNDYGLDNYDEDNGEELPY